MGQITKATIAMIRAAAERNEPPALTAWEYQQLAHMAERCISTPSALPVQAVGENWQIWCDTCEGKGTVYQEHQAGCNVGGHHDCPDCDGKGYFVKLLAAPMPQAEPTSKGEIGPIECDESMDRTYIPLPGGWEVQTQGKGSSFRLCNTESGHRWIVTDKHLHPVLEEMARDVHEASQQREPQEASKVEPVAWANPVILLPADEGDQDEKWTAKVQSHKDETFSLPLYAHPTPQALSDVKDADILSALESCSDCEDYQNADEHGRALMFARAVLSMRTAEL